MRPKTYLLDEDEHLQNLRKIIKRDFFVTNQQRQKETEEAIPLNLNDYLKNFKSNQNHIFAQLVHADSEQWKKKHQWMQKSKHLMIQPSKQKLFLNMISKDPTIKAINYSIVQQDAKNAIFFSPTRNTKSYNDPEHDKLKKVDYENCRIEIQQIQRAKVFKQKHYSDPNLEQIPSTPILQGRKERKYEKFQKIQKQYELKRIPSPQPQKLPIMTWGQVESTPLRISGQSQYRIPQKSARDDLLDQLTSKINKQKMIKKNRKQDIRTKILSSMRPAASSYRKVSVARQNSQKRTQTVKQQQDSKKLDNLLKIKK